MNEWTQEFRDRMAHFEQLQRMRPGDVSLSIKVRVSSGCFHREHSPNAYKLIDRALLARGRTEEFVLAEHESGPEILTIAADSLSILASVAAIVALIIDARSKGIGKGDHPSDPLNLIVRRFEDSSGLREETILRIPHTQEVSEQQISKLLNAAASRLLSPAPKNPQSDKKKAKTKVKKRGR